MRTILAAIAALAITGCATLRPNDVRLYAEHVSHISQHFGSDPKCYGYQTLNVSAEWRVKGAFLEVAEGYNLNGRSDWGEGYGALVGPRETFSARAGWDFKLK